MKTVVRVLFAILIIAVPVIPAFGQQNGGPPCCGTTGSPGNPGTPQNGGPPMGAPGPIAGAGLPFLGLGYGIYWLIKRRRRG
jgi:hypothetical protein